MNFAHGSELWVMGFTHVIQLGHMIVYLSYDWLRYVVQLTHTSHLIDFILRLTLSREWCDAEV